MMITPEQYVASYLKEAKQTEADTGFHYLISLTQGALEGDWGRKVPGYNFFGIKANASTPANKKQLFATTEILKTKTAKFPRIISIKDLGNGTYKYSVLDYFMKYESAAEAFKAHIQFFIDNPRYAEAVKHKTDPARFFDEIAKAGYATAPDYGNTLKAVMKSVTKRLPK